MLGYSRALMERREFVAIAATAAIATPALAEAKKDWPDYRKVFGLEEGDNLLGIAFCHEGDALTEEDRATLEGTPRWGALEGRSILAERVSKIATLSGIENLKGVSLHTGVLIELDRALESVNQRCMRWGSAANFDALIGGHALMNKEHKCGIATYAHLDWGQVFIPEYGQALALKKKFRGMAIWSKPIAGWTQG